MLDVSQHIWDVYEVTLGRADPLDSFNSFLGKVSLVIWNARPAMKEAHLEVISFLIDHILDLTIQLTRFYDAVILEYDRVFQTLLSTSFVECHVTEIAPDSARIKIGHIRSQHLFIIVHLQTPLEVLRVDSVFELARGLYIIRVFPVNNLDWYARIVAREEILLPSCLTFHREKETLELVLRFLQDDIERHREQ